MSTGYYLLDHPNPHGPHFYEKRNGPILAIVVHITAGLQDDDTVDDSSAERTAAYAAGTDRQVSWHSGSDTDTAFDLLPDEYVAFHCQGYNTHTLGHEISKSSPDWGISSGMFVASTLDQAAKHLAAKAKRHGIPIRWATRAELDREKANGWNGQPVGFIDHWALDPERRNDPGRVRRDPLRDTFPRQRFLDLITRHTNTEDGDMAWTQWPKADQMLMVDAVATEIIKRLSEDTPTSKASDRLKKAAHASQHLHDHAGLQD